MNELIYGLLISFIVLTPLVIWANEKRAKEEWEENYQVTHINMGTIRIKNNT